MMISEKRVDTFTPGERRQRLVFDDKDRGFGIRVGRHTKTYFVQVHNHGRIDIGRHGEISCVEARREAIRIKGDLTGRRPLGKAPTLRETMVSYFEYNKRIRPRPAKEVRRCIERHLDDWLDKPITAITGDMVERRHKRIGEGGPKPRKGAANGVMCYLRAILNRAKKRRLIRENPVEVLEFYPKNHKKEDRIGCTPERTKAAWDAINHLTSPDAQDLMLLLMFTGMRKSEALMLRWVDIDFQHRTLSQVNTKNGKELILPLTDFVFDLLTARQARLSLTAKKRCPERNAQVFPSRNERGKPDVWVPYMTEPKKQTRHAAKLAGFHFTLHDFRHFVVSQATAIGIPDPIIKAIVNHSGTDITDRYRHLRAEPLSGPMQRLTDHILGRVKGRGEESLNMVSVSNA